MTFKEELAGVIDDPAKHTWNITDGKVVPSNESIGLGNVGVRLSATMLYADLADSTDLATHSQTNAAEVYKAFLACCARIIIRNSGQIRSFDGDRIMGVFVEGNKNTNAAKAALQINYMFRNLLIPRFQQQYAEFKDGTLTLAHCTGVDTGSFLVARGGVRNNNDLIWVGEAPNVAAKLSTVRNAPYYSYISEAVYNSLNDSSKFGGTNTDMWTRQTWTVLPADKQVVYASRWVWEPV